MPETGKRSPTTTDRAAVRTVLDGYQAGGDVQARLPLLSTWLGHVDPKATYSYPSAALPSCSPWPVNGSTVTSEAARKALGGNKIAISVRRLR